MRASSLVAVPFGLLFLIFMTYSSTFGFSGQMIRDRPTESEPSAVSNRKLLGEEGKGNGTIEPNRIGESCSRDDVVVYQAATTPLPNGIPTYTVHVLNENVSGCSIGEIHLSCGWFSSARLVNPKVFRRLGYDNCLVNNGRPLANGDTLSFQYANSFRYPLSVSSASCN